MLNIWKSNNIVLNNPLSKEGIIIETGKYFNKNENTVYSNLQNTCEILYFTLSFYFIVKRKI